MVSKNNAQMKNRYATKQVPHYGIRKLSIGVASVLLSTTLYMGVTAHADTVNRVADNVTQPVIGDASTDKDTKTPASEVTSAAIAEASFVSMSPSNPSASQGSVATDAGAASTATNTAADSAPATSKVNKASYEPNGQVQSSSETNTTPTNLVRRPFMRLAAVPTTSSDELIVGKDVTISDFSVTAAEGKNEFENSHANIKFTMHADDPSALAGKHLTIQLDGKAWGSINYSETQKANPTTISYQGQVIGTLDYSFSSYFMRITFNNRVKDYSKITLQSDLVVSGIYQNTLPYETNLYTPTQAKDGQTYYLTNDVTIGQQKYSSNLPSVIHYYALKSDAVSSVISLTTTSYAQNDRELYAGTFYKTPNGIYYAQSATYSTTNLYDTKNGQPGSLGGFRLFVGTDMITDHTRSYTATFDIDQTKLSSDSNLKLEPIKSYRLFKDYFDDQDLLPDTSDVYINHSSTDSSTATADAKVTENSVIFNRLNGQSLATQNIGIKDSWNSRTSNYIDCDGDLYLMPALFKQLQAVAESDQNLAEAINTVTTTGSTAEIKLVNPINTGFKATITTSDGKTKELSLLIDTIEYPIKIASTAPKGAMLVAAQGKTAKVYHSGDQNIPAVVDQSQLTKTITRTINVHEPGKSVTTVKQTVVLTQSVSVVDGKDVTYNGDWKVQGGSQWASYDVPSVPGYTASQSRVAQQEVTDTTQDQTIEITYTANEHQISIEYVDNATGHVVKTDHLSGKTGQTVSITPHAPDGWELLSGQSVPSEVILGADGAPATVIKVQPQERSVTVKFVDDQSYDFDTIDHKAQVGQAITVTGRDGDTVDVKLTVPDKYQLADGQQLPTTYTFKKGSGDLTIHLKHQVVQREAAIDVQLALMTAVYGGSNEDTLPTITQTQWNQLDNKFKDHAPGPNDIVNPLVKVGTLTGHVNYDLVDAEVVSLGDDWTSFNLDGHTYQLPNGDDVVNGVFSGGEASWGEPFKEMILNTFKIQHVDVDPDYVNWPWHGYLSVNATNNSGFRQDLLADLVGDEPNALAKAIGDQAATSVEMSNKNIDLNLFQGYYFDFSEQNGQLRAKAALTIAGVYVPYVEKTATRTINVTTPDGKTTAFKQTATLAKQIDFADNAHPTWTTSEWSSYDVPVIPGYTASQPNVAQQTVTGTTEDQTINITYAANPQTTHINYVDAQRKLIHTTTVNGQTDQTVELPNEVPDGWMLYSGQSIPKSITFQAVNNDRDYVVKHVQSFVLSTAPKEAGTIIEGTKAKTYPAGVSDADLNKTVTRTILIKDANGRTVNTKTQTVHFVRNAIVDAVTGHIDYLGWSEDGSHIFAAYVPVPKNGYTINSAKTVTVTPNDTDSTVELTYKTIPKTITVEYMTTDGKQVASQDVKADDNNQVKFVAPNGYVLATNTNTVDVSDLNVNIYRVLVRANEQTYTAGSTNIPKNVKNLTKVVTRTIVIVMPNGHKRTIKQRVTFERTATVKSDGSVVYTDYQPVGHDAFNHIFVAHRFGYNLNFSDGSKSVARVDHVTADTPDQTIVVTYVRKNAN